MNNVELARTLSWRENALFEERKRTLSVNPKSAIKAFYIGLEWFSNNRHQVIIFANRYITAIYKQKHET